jgi:hypothetical protein
MEKSPIEIVDMLSHDSARQRALGLTFIGKQRCQALVEQCVSALHDEDGDVRAMAAWALDRLSSPKTVPDLIAALYDPLFGVRSNAGWALVHIAQRIMPQVVVPDVVDVMVEGEDEDARQMAYLVLRYIGCEESREAINRYWRR